MFNAYISNVTVHPSDGSVFFIKGAFLKTAKKPQDSRVEPLTFC